MKRILLFAFAAGLAACAHNTDMASNDVATTSLAQTTSDETTVVDNPGQVTVAGIPPSEALGAVDSKQVAEKPAIAGGEQTTGEPKPETASNEGTIAVEGAQPAAVLAAIDPKKIAKVDDAAPTETASAEAYIAPEVQAVVDSKKSYTTKDLALAQLEAVRNGG